MTVLRRGAVKIFKERRIGCMRYEEAVHELVDKESAYIINLMEAAAGVLIFDLWGQDLQKSMTSTLDA